MQANEVLSEQELIERIAQGFLSPQRLAPGEWFAAPGIVDLEFETSPQWSVARRLGLTCYVFGMGVPVLFVHGWEGRGSDFAHFVKPLVERGYQVVAVDLPAHGQSEGHRMSIPLAAQAVLAVHRHLGPWRAAIAHSMGGPILAEAMALGLETQRAVLMAPPNNYAVRARQIAKMAGMTSTQSERLLQRISALIEAPIEQFDLPARVRQFRQPALFIHSEDDRIVTAEEVVQTQRAWLGAELMAVNGLGHRRLLNAPDIIERVVNFID